MVFTMKDGDVHGLCSFSEYFQYILYFKDIKHQAVRGSWLGSNQGLGIVLFSKTWIQMVNSRVRIPPEVWHSPWKMVVDYFHIGKVPFFFWFCPKKIQVVSWSASLAGSCITPLRCLCSLKNLQAIPGGFDNLNILSIGKSGVILFVGIFLDP